MQISDKLIVIGGSHHNTLGVVRALGERGYGVDLITIGKTKEHYVSKSRYVKKHHELEDVKELVSHLLFRDVPFDGKKEIVISCSDIVTEHLNLFRERLRGRYILPGCEKDGAMADLMDKTVMIEMASKRELRAPTVWQLPAERDIVTFPCITKAHVSSHGGKGDVRIFREKQSFILFLESCHDDIFAQEYIDKSEEVQFIGCSLRGGDEVIIPGMTHILRSQPNTNTGFLEYGPIDNFWKEIVERSKLYIKDCGYSGLFSIEFIRSKENKVYFLEINFRNDGNAWCVTASGVNLPVIWAKACRGEDYSMEIRDVRPVVIMPEFQDFKMVLQRKVGVAQWLLDVLKADSFLDWNRADKKPFFWFILSKLL